MGLRVLDGRAYLDELDADEVVVNQLLASHLAPGGAVVGSCLHFDDSSNSCSPIVGVVENAPHRGLSPYTARYYRPLVPDHGRALLVRSDPTGPTHATEIREKMASIVPGLTDVEVEALSATVKSQLVLPRAASSLTRGFMFAGILIWAWVIYSFRRDLPRRPGLTLLMLITAATLGTTGVVGLQRLLAPLQTARPDPALPALLAVLFVSTALLLLHRLARHSRRSEFRVQLN